VTVVSPDASVRPPRDKPNRFWHLQSEHSHDASASVSTFPMSKERSFDLAQLCTELVRKGNDFPTIWTTVLKSNPLFDVIAQSKHEGTRSVFEVRLFTGERLVFDGEAKKFGVI